MEVALQWGRDSSVAEITLMVEPNPIELMPLQWGRDSSVAEMAWLPYRASPPSWRFNGAATLQSRK